MQPVRIVFTDIDGTLLDRERNLSMTTRAELMRVSGAGVPVVLASSRMPRAMRYFLEECGIDHPLICYNGGLVLSARGKSDKERVIFSKTIPFKVLFAVAAFWTDSPIHMSVYRNDEWFTEDEDSWLEREQQNTRTAANVLPMATLVEMWQLRQMGPHKIMCMGDPEELTILELLLQREFKNQVTVYRTKESYLELTAPDISKDFAAELILDEAGLDFSAAAAFGDGVNDVSLVRRAGHGFAVENAVPEVKRIARRVVPAHHADGVARTLQTLVPD